MGRGGGGSGIAFTAHHLHFHTQFVMSVTRQGESRASRREKMAASTPQMGEGAGAMARGKVAAATPLHRVLSHTARTTGGEETERVEEK